LFKYGELIFILLFNTQARWTQTLLQWRRSVGIPIRFATGSRDWNLDAAWI
jgi:hypothetical protein